MRMVWLMGFALALAGCAEEPSFDQRFNDTAKDIEERANAIDRELEAEAEANSA